MKYTWCVEKEDAFHAIYALIYNSDLRNKWGLEDIRRRIVIPLFLGQLLSFYDDNNTLAGFLTYAFMDDFCGAHQEKIGVLPADWRSGHNFWVVDLVAPNGDGDAMLRKVVSDMKGADIGTVRYFRLKTKQTREVYI
jgi:hemolysin-activating ACP:hemolysin acyltransferase